MDVKDKVKTLVYDFHLSDDEEIVLGYLSNNNVQKHAKLMEDITDHYSEVFASKDELSNYKREIKELISHEKNTFYLLVLGMLVANTVIFKWMGF